MISNIAMVSKNKAKHMCVNWKSATSFGNFYRSDPCLDLFYKRNPRTLGDFLFPRVRRSFRFTTDKKSGKIRMRLQPPAHIKEILRGGNDFEKTVLQRIRSLYPNRLEIVGAGPSFTHSNKNYAKTLHAVKKGDVDVIIHGVVRNYDTQTFGCPDLIVKGRAMHKLGVHTPVNMDKYYAVDIKGSKIEMRVGGGIINDYKTSGYKSQILIYAMCLNEMQKDFHDMKGFILGKEYAFSNATTFESHQMLATVDFDTYDRPYEELLQDAIDWHNWVDIYGSDPNAVYKKKEYMYPNMKNTFNLAYGDLKEQYAEHIDEITRMWNVGPGMRKVAFAKNIFKLEDVKSVKDLGINPISAKGNIISTMLDMKKHPDPMYIPDDNNVLKWRTEHTGSFKEEWIVDIETADDIIYLIGILTPERYYSLTSEALDAQGEKGILTELMTMMERKSLKVWSWGHYDYSTINRKMESHGMRLPPCEWCDMTKVLKDAENPVGIKGALGFGLKEVSSALAKSEVIRNRYEFLDCKGGLESMFMAKKAYDTNDWPTMEKLIKYNKADCYTVKDVISYMRSL